MVNCALSIEANPAAVRSSLDWFRKCLIEDCRLDWADDCRELQGALGEAVANAIIHGGRFPIGRDSDGLPNPCPIPARDHVRIELCYCPSGVLQMLVMDMGMGFDLGDCLMPAPEASNGRGVPLMRAACEVLECFARNGEWFCVRMARQLRRGAGGWGLGVGPEERRFDCA